jgi:hypothetical protein
MADSEMDALRLASGSAWRRFQLCCGLAASVFIVLAVQCAGVARADDPSPIQRETARGQMEEGMKRRSLGDFRAALESFAAADALVHTPTTGYEVGATQAQLGRLIEARSKLLDVVRLPVRRDDPPQFAQARADAARLSDDLADRIPSIRVHVRGPAPDDLQLVVDGSLIPSAALSVPLKVNPGRHDVALSGGGRRSAVEVTVLEHEVRDVECVLPPAPALLLPPRPSPSPAPPSRRVASPVVYSSFGVAIAGFALGTASGIVALIDKSQLDGVCHGSICPSTAASEVHAADGWAAVSTVSFVVVATAAVVGVIDLIVGPWSQKSAWREAVRGRLEF